MQPQLSIYLFIHIYIYNICIYERKQYFRMWKVCGSRFRELVRCSICDVLPFSPFLRWLGVAGTRGSFLNCAASTAWDHKQRLRSQLCTIFSWLLFSNVQLRLPLIPWESLDTV